MIFWSRFSSPCLFFSYLYLCIPGFPTWACVRKTRRYGEGIDHCPMSRSSWARAEPCEWFHIMLLVEWLCAVLVRLYSFVVVHLKVMDFFFCVRYGWTLLWDWGRDQRIQGTDRRRPLRRVHDVPEHLWCFQNTGKVCLLQQRTENQGLIPTVCVSRESAIYMIHYILHTDYK